ncbi:MAG: NAD(P)/FAD-dependent oxidoreductase [Anaerolineales bacterium]|nr:MAG: NAD(P)/FAD-dependent oxidoreductase [Anaerolineales bacterium]
MDKDILILGGGPSGLSTALHLAKIAPHLTPRILILEKEYYPRLKLCAGGLVIDAEVILERLGLDAREVPHVDASNVRFDFEGRGLAVRVPRRHAIRVIRRDEFDHWLAQKAMERGIEIKQGVSVKNVIPDENGVTVQTNQGEFRAAIVIGADGSNGVTRHCIFPNEPVYTARVLEVITPNYSVIANTSEAISNINDQITSRENTARNDAAYFDFFAVPENIAGYVWDFPTQINGQPMRCWGIYDTNLLADQKRPALKEPLAAEMKRLGFDLNDYEIKGHPIRWYSPWNKASVPRVLLVGDAVGADPIFGEGISMALGYGAVAAQEISESFQRGEFSFRRYKRRLVRSGLGQTLFARWVITQVIYSFKWKWFQILLWRIMKPIVLLAAWIFVLNWSRRLPKLTTSHA